MSDYLSSLFSVAGKTALVTGGAGGIGRMISTALVLAGARVLIASRKGDACAAVAARLNADAEAAGSAGRAEGFAGDVATEEGVLALAAEVRARVGGRLDILVNNAGRSWGSPIETFPYRAWSDVFALNLFGLFTLTRELLPELTASAELEDPARVINLGSVMGTAPIGRNTYSYATSKAAVHHLTRILAQEFARRPITVNALAPGPFPSRMTAFAIGTEEGQSRVGQAVPMGRVGLPSDVAGTILYLCGRGGSYTTGAVIPIDGGISVDAVEDLFEEAE